jgi:4-carboxymuconolactone decarboxylase
MNRITNARGVLLLLVLVFAGAGSADAQERMPPIPADKLTAEQKKAVEEYKAARGGMPGGPFAALLRSPEVMSRGRALSDYLRYKSVLPPRLSEFVILLTARQWTQNYEWNAHQPLAVKGGLNPEIIKAVAEGRRPERMAEDEEAIYNFCTELQRNHSVSDATYARMVSKFGEQGVIDTIGLSGWYTLVAMTLNTARTQLPSGASPGLTAFP